MPINHTASKNALIQEKIETTIPVYVNGQRIDISKGITTIALQELSNHCKAEIACQGPLKIELFRWSGENSPTYTLRALINQKEVALATINESIINGRSLDGMPVINLTDPLVHIGQKIYDMPQLVQGNYKTPVLNYKITKDITTLTENLAKHTPEMKSKKKITDNTPNTYTIDVASKLIQPKIYKNSALVAKLAENMHNPNALNYARGIVTNMLLCAQMRPNTTPNAETRSNILVADTIGFLPCSPASRSQVQSAVDTTPIANLYVKRGGITSEIPVYELDAADIKRFNATQDQKPLIATSRALCFLAPNGHLVIAGTHATKTVDEMDEHQSPLNKDIATSLPEAVEQLAIVEHASACSMIKSNKAEEFAEKWNQCYSKVFPYETELISELATRDVVTRWARIALYKNQ